MAETKTSESAAEKFAATDYPTIDLETAVSRAREVYKNDKQHAVSIDVLAEHWGYKPKSSGLGLTASALKKYGLLTKADIGKVKLTELALHIILDAESAEGVAAIKQAATTPELYGTLWKKYGPELPSDTSLKKMLVMDLNFHERIAVDVMNKYRKTLAFAKMDQGSSAAIPEGGDQKPAGNLPIQPQIPAQVIRPKQPGAREFRLSLGNGEAFISVPPGTTAEDVDLLIQTLTLWKPRMVTKAE
ncbi:MAG: hypothetical protein HYV14_05750 [Elusimicrobia bacterium]|nr:hypothetical protein [Elusimicrobiota bacterium]